MRRSRADLLPLLLPMLLLSPWSSASDREVGHVATTPGPSVERTHRYVVNARVRPLLLFWIGRQNVGSGEFTWRTGPGDAHGIEILIGSDPRRAPRQINRWGYIAEETDAGTTRVLGLMTDSSEQSLDEAEARVSRERGGGRAFKAVRTTVADGEAVSASTRLTVAEDWTYRDLSRVLELLPRETAKTRTMRLPPETAGGFLLALDDMMQRAIVGCSASRRHDGQPLPARQYVYNATLYRLSVESCESRIEEQTGTPGAPAIDARFQVKNLSTNNTTKFRVAYGATGALSGVPMRVVFRPQWWFEVELILDDKAAW